MIDYETSPRVRPRRAAEARLAALVKRIATVQGRVETRRRRYLVSSFVAIIVIWSIVGSYLLLTPKVFTSQMTLILPASARTSNFSVDTIGQATTNSPSPFGLNSLSPKVIYKSIAESERVRGLAARKLGVEFEAVPKPRIDLIDETALMIFKVTGRSPEQARDNAQALLDSLLLQLDELRNDEIERRSASVGSGLAKVEGELKNAAAAFVGFQRQHGIVSMDQLKDLSQQVDSHYRRITELETELVRLRAQRDQLCSALGITPAEAAQALRLQGDPRFGSLAKENAEALSAFSSASKRWGANHPKVIEARVRYAASREMASQLAVKLVPDIDVGTVENLMLVDSKDRSELFRAVVEYDSQAGGMSQSLLSMTEVLAQMKRSLEERSTLAARLDQLEREHRIAEALFSSTLARIDSGRQDVFASYPLVQVMAEPSLPQSPTSPRPLFGLLGGGVASILVALALGLTWIRKPFVRKLLKSA